MYVCRLFHRDRPFEQLDVRVLSQGRLTLGRDPSSDWPLDDPEATLSRLHCVLAVNDGRLTLYDRSSNGVFLQGGERAPFDTAVVLADRESFQLGALSILVERQSEDAIDGAATVMLVPGWDGPTPVATAWVEDDPLPTVDGNASLVEAFCEGARIDASGLSSEDPADLMRRVGAIYQQTVLGLTALMADRAKLKRDIDLKGTTIAGQENNPFKWTGSRQLAQDLICGPEAAFLSDSAAVRACFQDLSLHMAAVIAGAEAAATEATRQLDPQAIEMEARSQASLLRGRSAAARDILAQRHGDLIEGASRRAFAAAYERASVAAANR